MELKWAFVVHIDGIFIEKSHMHTTSAENE